ncbi:MAG: 5-(carboxyamino)imidazole ribonucleotide synthase [Polyangiaceae bacterium]
MAILPGETIGILGGGQLGRMFAMAARSLGYHLRVLDPDPSCAARFVVDALVTAPFDDPTAAAWLARGCAVVTLEIEKISLDAMAAAAKHAPMRPSGDVLAIIQDRLAQKRWLEKSGFPVGAFRAALTAEEVVSAANELGGMVFVKSATGGYDGRGQVVLAANASEAEKREAFALLGNGACVVEKGLELHQELSVLVARRPSGQAAVYPPALNHHVDRILDWSVIPGPFSPELTAQAMDLAREVASKIGAEGLLVVEMFLLKDGSLLVNELAPRPHNSFHATEVACLTSQFEQMVRAICDLPLGSTEVVRPAAIANLLGEAWLGDGPPAFDAALSDPGVRLHLYGKRVPRLGRKMGHFSAIGATPEEAVKRVCTARDRLQNIAR